MTTEVSKDIKENRIFALKLLKYNPRNYVKINSLLTNSKRGRCATGLIAEGFHIPLEGSSHRVYDKLTKMLDIPYASQIYRKNDSGMSFTQTAEKLAEDWNIPYADV